MCWSQPINNQRYRWTRPCDSFYDCKKSFSKTHQETLKHRTWILPTHLGTHCEVVSGERQRVTTHTVAQSSALTGVKFGAQGFEGSLWVNLGHRKWKYKALKDKKTSSQNACNWNYPRTKEDQWEELFSLLAGLCLFQIATFETDAVQKKMPWRSQPTSGICIIKKKNIQNCLSLNFTLENENQKQEVASHIF